MKALQTANAALKTKEIEDAFGAKDITTEGVKSAIASWFSAYYDRVATEKQDPSQRIPYVIVNKLTRTAFSEFEAKSDIRFAQNILDSLEQRRKKCMQQALIGGEALLKPVISPNGSITFSVISRQNYLVFGRDADGMLTDIGTNEVTAGGGFFYTLLERRTVDGNGYLTIRNTLYRSQAEGVLGSAVPLSHLDKYAALRPKVRYSVPIWTTGLVSVRTPMENCVDDSLDSVSVFEPALGLMRLININEAQINGEFERGESRIVVSNDLMDTDEYGRRSFVDHVYSGLPDDPERVGVTIFSPAFREQSFLARKAEYLRNAESLIGLKRGILSEVEAAERTATEVTSSAGDYNLTIIDFQQMWESAVREAARLCGVLGKLYDVPGASELGGDDITITWGNGILYDEDKEWERLLDMVARGMLKPEIALAWKYNLPWDTEEQLIAIRAKYMPELDKLLASE